MREGRTLMRNLHRPAALVLALAGVPQLSAQIIGTLPPPSRSGTIASGSTHHGGKLKFSVFLSNSYPSGYYGPFSYLPLVGNSVTVVTVYAPPPVAETAPTPRELELLRDLN